MTPIFQRLRIFSRENKIQGKLFNFFLLFHFQSTNYCSHNHTSLNFLLCHSKAQDLAFRHNAKPQTLLDCFHGWTRSHRFVHSLSGPTENGDQNEDEVALWIQNIMKFRRDKPVEEIERALDRCRVVPTEALLLNVLRRHRSDWKPAFVFFNWASNGGGRDLFSPGIESYNEIIDILGRMRRFEEVGQVFDKMSQRKGLVNEATYGILLNRFAAAHRVDEAIDVFHRRKEFGLELDSGSFRTLLMWLCRYKHVEVAETLFYSMRSEFRSDIKTWNVILNGWCVRGNVHEAKRFWKDILASKCRPDLFTYGTFINALTKKGKLGLALKLFRAMWDNGCDPDVTICNCIINALCFKKRIPEALEVVREMKEQGCQPNVATYNTLIKYMCKIRRMEKVYEILDDMEQKRGDVLPNHVTYSFLLKSLRKPDNVPELLERMERNGIGMTCDTHNMILKLYMDWGCEEGVRHTWNEMERKGFGPDQRAYTIMIHGLHDKGRTKDALRYFKEMKSKGMEPEPRTEILLNSSNADSKERKP